MNRLLALLVCLAALLVACSNSSAATLDGERAERPAATSTPSDSAADANPAGGTIRLPVVTNRGGSTDEDVPDEEITGEPLPPYTDEISRLSTEEQLEQVIVPQRDLRDLAVRLKPGVDEVPVVVSEEPANYEVGTTLDFWVTDLQAIRNFEIEAELIHRTEVAYVWVEAGETADRASIIEAVENFSEGAYPAVREIFGSEWNPGVDGDPRLHILHASGLGGGIAGYYSSADEYSALANEFSNEKEMFYIHLSWLNTIRDYEIYETVLAHEFQHMIHWYRDRNEETWINEGLSELAQEVANYDPDTSFARIFASVPDTQLNTWNQINGSNAEHYGSAFLFTSYILQRFGAETIQALVSNAANGLNGVDDVLEPFGFSADELFADWVVANYLDDPNALGEDGLYGYRGYEQAAPALAETFDAYPVDELDATVNNYAADYILLEGDAVDGLTVDFVGEPSTRLANVEPLSGERMWWANRSDDSDARLTREFDLTGVEAGTPVALNVAMWYDIEVDYDYGYVQISTDGEEWDILPGQRTTLENPSGNSYGAGYTGLSTEAAESTPFGDAQWVVETFDLNSYAGQEISLRFEYVTDDAVNTSGWFVDDIEIVAGDELLYDTDFESGIDGWQSEGWLLTDGVLRQGWLLQILSLEDNRLVDLSRTVLDDTAQTTLDVPPLGDGRTAVLIISALARVTTEAASYELSIE